MIAMILAHLLIALFTQSCIDVQTIIFVGCILPVSVLLLLISLSTLPFSAYL